MKANDLKIGQIVKVNEKQAKVLKIERDIVWLQDLDNEFITWMADPNMVEITAMTNEEKARQLANDNCTHICLADAESYFSSENDCYKAAMQAMEWKEKLFAKERQQWIDKACEWIKDNAAYYAHWECNGDTYENEVVFDGEECADAFKQSMKGE